MSLAFHARLTDLIHCALHGFFDASIVAFAAVYLRTINIDGLITFLFSPSNQKPLLKSASRDWNYPLRCFSLAWCISRVPTSKSRITAGRTPLLYSPDWVSHLSDGKLLSPIAFGCAITPFWSFVASCSCNHSFPEFRGVIFRRTSIPWTAHLAVLFPIFSRHMLYGGQALHSCIILPSSGRTRALRYPPMFLSNNA